MSSINTVNAFISQGNSTSALLGGGAVFTGTAERVLNATCVTVTVFADQASAADGLQVQFSTDGTNWDISNNRSVTASTARSFSFAVVAKFFRVVYTNGSVVQTAFRLQTLINNTASCTTPTSGHAVMSVDTNVDAIRQINIPLDDIARGKITDAKVVNVYARNPDVDTAEEDVWFNGGSYTFPTAAETLRAVSSDANDTAAGTGARQITISGLNGSFKEITETLTMNGTSNTADTTLSFMRINSVRVTQTGTYGGANDGSITVTNTVSGDTLANIEAGRGVSQLSMYAVDADCVAILRTAVFNASNNSDTRVCLVKRENALTVSAPFSGREMIMCVEAVNQNSVAVFNQIEELITGPADIWAIAAAGANTGIDVNYTIVIYPK